MRTLFERRAAMAEKYQSRGKKSNRKFEVLGAKRLAMHLPLPLVEVWEELQPQVERPNRAGGIEIIRAVIEDEVTRRVGPRHHPEAASQCVRWGQQSGFVMFAGQKVPGDASSAHPRRPRSCSRQLRAVATRRACDPITPSS